MNSETTPGFAAVRSGTRAELQGQKRGASSPEVTLLALCSFRAESGPQGGRNGPAKDSLGPPFTLNPLRP